MSLLSGGKAPKTLSLQCQRSDKRRLEEAAAADLRAQRTSCSPKPALQQGTAGARRRDRGIYAGAAGVRNSYKQDISNCDND